MRSETSPDRGTTTFIHDAAGNLTRRIDARGARMDTAYDALNRPTERRLLRPDGSLEATHTYTWDSAPNGIGRLGELATGTNTLAFAYDLAGRLTARTYTRVSTLLAVHWAYHSGDGLLDALTYPSGSVITYDYDDAGRPVRLEWDGQPIAGDIEYFPFGPPTALILANGLDHLRDYDTAGRLTAYTLAGEAIGIDYDAAGRIAALTPTTRTLHEQAFDYDPAGRLTDYHNLTHAEAYTYDANGNRTIRERNGQLTPYGYAPASNRLTDIGNLHLSYDLAGNLAADTRVLTHDSSGRLIEIRAGAQTTRYEYNGLGERVSKQAPGPTRPARLNVAAHPSAYQRQRQQNLPERHWKRGWFEVTARNTGDAPARAVRGSVLSTDARVRVVSGDTPFGDIAAHGQAKSQRLIVLDYDVRGRFPYAALTWHLQGTTEPAATAGTARHYVYDEAGKLLGEYDGTGQPLAEYAWLGDLPVAMRRYAGEPAQAELYAIETDHLGTPRLLTDASQRIRWRWHSSPFGDTAPDENPEGHGPLVFNLRFPGQYFDAESGLHYNYFRDYDPQSGRYVQSDPIGLEGGVNTYAYVLGNPISYIDPDGHAAAAAAAAAAVPALQWCVRVIAFLAGAMAASSEDAPSREQCKQDCVVQYERDAKECGVAKAFWGNRGYQACMARAGDFLAQCMRTCDGK